MLFNDNLHKQWFDNFQTAVSKSLSELNSDSNQFDSWTIVQFDLRIESIT